MLIEPLPSGLGGVSRTPLFAENHGFIAFYTDTDKLSKTR